MTHKLVHIAQRDLAHLVSSQVTDRVWQLDQGVTVHSLAAESMDRRALENLRQKYRRRYAALLEFHRVVHTAQRAGPSPANRGGRHVDLTCHFVDEAFACWFGVILLAPDDHLSHPVTLA